MERKKLLGGSSTQRIRNICWKQGRICRQICLITIFIFYIYSICELIRIDRIHKDLHKHTINDDDDDVLSNNILNDDDDDDNALSNIISLRNLLSSPDGAIHGDPTANPICQQALLRAENRDEQNIRGEYQEQQQRFGWWNDRYRPPKNLLHEFWSRESLSATIAPPGHNGLSMDGNIFTTSKAEWTVSNYTSTSTDTFNRSIKTLKMIPFPLVRSSSNVSITIPTVAYLQIVKAGSSSIRLELNKIKERAREFAKSEGKPMTDIHTKINENTPDATRGHYKLQSDCFFTFVRDPLHRLISSYFTIHSCMEYEFKMRPHAYQQVAQNARFWKVKTEPERFRTFVRELQEQTNRFVSLPVIEHAISMSGQVSTWFGSGITFIGRQERFSDHWDLLTNQDEVCRRALAGSSDPVVAADKKEQQQQDHKQQPLTHAMKMVNQGLSTNLSESLGVSVNLLMGNNNTNSQGRSKGSKNYDLPQWKAILGDQELFNSIVEHYWQDYVCFGYTTSYPDLGLKYTGNYTMPY